MDIINPSFKYFSIMVVDDDPAILGLIKSILEMNGFSDITVTNSPLEAISLYKEFDYKLVIIDYSMPEMNGLDLINELMKINKLSQIIVVTGILEKEDLLLRSLKLGVCDFIIKPINKLKFINSVNMCLEKGNLLQDNFLYQIKLEKLIFEKTDKLQKILLSTAKAFGKTLSLLDPYTAEHQIRVARLCRAIAKRMGLDSYSINGLNFAAYLHDIGKINVPINILAKPGILTENEFNLIKDHSNAGAEVLYDIPFDCPVAVMVKQHHEKLDGSGYPDGLIGREILLESQILTVADMCEAMISHRPYRPSLGIRTAFKILRKQAGKQLNSEAVIHCINIITECNELICNSNDCMSTNIISIFEILKEKENE